MAEVDTQARREYQKRWRAENREALLQKKRAYYHANKESILKKQTIYQEVNSEKIRSYKKKWRLKNIEKVRLRDKAYREQHQNTIRIYKQLWHISHREEIIEKQKKYWPEYSAKTRESRNAKNRAKYSNNVENERTKSRAYYLSHKNQIKANQRKYNARHPEVSICGVERRRARIIGAEISDFTRKDWEAMKSAYAYRCVYCEKKQKRLTMDHITPLSKGGNHTLSNIVPACTSCNARKNSGAPLCPVQPMLLLVGVNHE